MLAVHDIVDYHVSEQFGRWAKYSTHLRTFWDLFWLILYKCWFSNCDHSFPMHTDLEIQVPTVENLAQSNVLHLRPGIGQNVAMHVSPIAINDKLQSLCPLSLCPNYCLYWCCHCWCCWCCSYFTSFSSFFLFALLYFFLRWWCVADIKTQELTAFVFILPGSVCHSSFNIEIRLL